ncbi:26S proteasome non-ATPase regulatory subunit 2 1B [Acorus gramineus]|uniref:26S proteasome non-ATPase regulatory subunit 2 homolog n=1 Tax=Acorus gramineus TaxID=55184 RepID=A0AAV9ADM4_ACOGR|nr:26S proteasome non-ATPase regulatory subunit 2 1B [Acorus gramineus]
MAIDTNPNSTSKAPLKDQKKKKYAKKEEDLSEEDADLIDRLELYVDEVQRPDPELQSVALERLREEIRSSTSSMTSVPKPLKYLKSHYPFLCAFFKKLTKDSDIRKKFADILSVLSMTMAKGDRIKGKLIVDLIFDLMDLVKQIVAFQMQVEQIYLLDKHVDETNYKRTCLYLTSYCRYNDFNDYPGMDDRKTLLVVSFIYKKFKDYTSALRVALFLDNIKVVKYVFTVCEDMLQKKQLCYIIARHGMILELDDEMAEKDEDREALQDIINNFKLSAGYLYLARDLEVMEPKYPEDVYKDKLMTFPSESSSDNSSYGWIFKNKEHGKASAAASLGMILLWDIDSGLARIDKCLHSDDNQIVAGALLGVGIVTCGIKNDCEPEFQALSLLLEFTNNSDTTIRIGAIMGLGIAYAGSRKEELGMSLVQILVDTATPLDVLAFTAISLGLVYVGSCNEEFAQSIISALRKNSEEELNGSLICPMQENKLQELNMQADKEYIKATAEVFDTFNYIIKNFCRVTLLSLAFAGTGDVNKILQLQRCIKQDIERNELYQGPAVLGIALIAMGEELGLDMAIRAFEHFLQYGKENIRRAVPLALGLLCISNPKVNVIDTLSRLSHDPNGKVSMAAIISLGLIGAGTNNARIAGLLRNLSSYYYKDPQHVFCPRMLLTVDENLDPITVLVRVGKAVDVVGQAGQPRTITGFKTYTTPMILAAGDRAELATEKYIPLSPVLEGFVILRENPDYREEK